MKTRILGFAGSLRKGSYNRALLKAAESFVPAGAVLETIELDGIPAFNQDQESNMPEKVLDFKNKIKSADALLIVTPEHNYSVPGVLKNAIDWASRPHGDNSFKDKPVAIMSASTGMLGGARAQYHLRQMFVYLQMHPVDKPEIFVTFAASKFDRGELIDETALSLIRQLLEALVEWTKKIS